MASSKTDNSNFEQPGPDCIATGDEAPRSDHTSQDGAEEHPSHRGAGRTNMFAGLSKADQVALAMNEMSKRGLDPAGRMTIEFEVTSERQSKFFAMAAGQEAVVHVTCLGTDGEWQRLEVRKVIWGRQA